MTFRITLTDEATVDQILTGETRTEAFKALAEELAERNGETKGLKASVARGIVRNSEATYPHDVHLQDEPELFWETNAGHLLGDNQDYTIHD